MNAEIVKKIADRMHDECFEAHRGAFWWDENRRLAVAFANDGQGDRQNFEIAAVRQLLRDYDGKEVGFATSNDYSFSLVCQLPAALTPDLLESVLWIAWNTISFHRHKGRIDPVKLDWDAIKRGINSGSFGSLEGAFTGIQADIARATLERNGLAD